MKVRQAKEGESIYEIAAEYCISPHYLMTVSGVGGRPLCNGREVIIPLPSRTAVAKVGDTPEAISHRFGVKTEEIYALNPEIWLSGRLYPSQYVVLKLAEPKIGVAAVNGQIYGGITRERVKRALPYLNTLTVAAARASGARIRSDGTLMRFADMARRAGVCPILRIYLEDMPRTAWEDFARGAVMLAASRGFSGLALGGVSRLKGEAAELTLSVRRAALEAGLSLSVEGELGKKCEYADYADTAVMTLDKAELSPIPSFEDFEVRIIESTAEVGDVSNMLLELPAFALSGGEFISRDEIFGSLDLRGTELLKDDKSRMITVRRGRRLAVCESVENTLERIRLAVECGFLGFSADLARVPFPELFALYAMTHRPMNMGNDNPILDCTGEKNPPSA